MKSELQKAVDDIEEIAMENYKELVIARIKLKDLHDLACSAAMGLIDEQDLVKKCLEI
jgi:hypothetical protein